MLAASALDIKGPSEVSVMEEAGAILGEVLAIVSQAAGSKVSSLDLDQLAYAEILRRKAKPAFLNYRGFPATLCVSVNEEVVHGIPRSDKILGDGDVVSLDLGCVFRGFYADAAITLGIGAVLPQACRLMEVTRTALMRGIEQLFPDRRLGDCSHAVQSFVETQGMSVVRQFVGHGIGRKLHEDPPVPNYGSPGRGVKLVAGMVLAVEPMVSLGRAEVRVLEDGWTAVTCDGSLSAHFEHTVAILETGPRILTLPPEQYKGIGSRV